MGRWQIWGGWKVHSHTAGVERSCQFYSLGLSLFSPHRLQSSTQVFKVPNCTMVYQNFSNRTENKVWGNQTNSWLWAKCGSLTLQITYFSTWKLSSLLRNTVLQWLISAWPQVSGLQKMVLVTVMAVWHLVDSLLWKCCLEGVLEFKKKPYEFKLPVLCYEHVLIFPFNILCNH